MKVGALYDPRANELRIRLRGATGAESRHVFLYLARFLQLLPLPELDALGQAIHGTLEADGGGTGQEENNASTSSWMGC